MGRNPFGNGSESLNLVVIRCGSVGKHACQSKHSESLYGLLAGDLKTRKAKGAVCLHPAEAQLCLLISSDVMFEVGMFLYRTNGKLSALATYPDGEVRPTSFALDHPRPDVPKRSVSQRLAQIIQPVGVICYEPRRHDHDGRTG